MNPYAMLASGNNTPTASSLAVRLAAWHDGMVAHERRLRTGRTADVCDDECPHVDARTLWAEALAAFGERAHELTFLRSRATHVAQPVAEAVPPPSIESERRDNGRPPDGDQRKTPHNRLPSSSSLRVQHITAEAEL